MTPSEKMWQRLLADGFDPDEFTCEYMLAPGAGTHGEARLIQCRTAEVPDHIERFLCYGPDKIPLYDYAKGREPEIKPSLLNDIP